MSIDVRLSHPCTHIIMEEVVPLSGRDLVPSSKMSSSRTVRVLVNDQYYVPPGGLGSSAVLLGSSPGPHRIDSCKREIVISTSQQTVSLMLPNLNVVSTEDVIRLFRQSMSHVSFLDVAGRIQISDSDFTGPTSRVLVSGSGASSIGFGVQRGARGKWLYPGWSVVSFEDGKKVVFEDDILGDPVFKMTYIAESSSCPRCDGMLIENDYRYDMLGNMVMVQDENLLYQASLKILLTTIRSNPYHPTYGSAINSRIGSKAVGAVASQITSDVQTALSNMQQMQQAQSKFQAVSLRERLYSVSSVRVTQDPSDQTTFKVDVVVSNGSGLPVDLSVLYRYPGTRSSSR